MTVDYSSIGLKIRYYRQQQNITQEELAFEIETSAAYISNIERGIKKPSLQKLLEIANVLNVTPNDLLYMSSSEIQIIKNYGLEHFLTMCPPDKQQLLLNSISSIIQTFITQ